MNDGVLLFLFLFSLFFFIYFCFCRCPFFPRAGLSQPRRHQPWESGKWSRTLTARTSRRVASVANMNDGMLLFLFLFSLLFYLLLFLSLFSLSAASYNGDLVRHLSQQESIKCCQHKWYVVVVVVFVFSFLFVFTFVFVVALFFPRAGLFQPRRHQPGKWKKSRTLTSRTSRRVDPTWPINLGQCDNIGDVLPIEHIEPTPVCVSPDENGTHFYLLRESGYNRVHVPMYEPWSVDACF